MRVPTVTAVSRAPTDGAAARRYRAFLSYSHADSGWARWLMRRLEGYAVPKRFYGRTAPIGMVGRRIAPVFRDRDELPTTSDLGETIRAALADSATLIVICSPSAARSRWVQEEITAFKQLHGEHHVFAFIVSGEPKQPGAGDDCFSPALRVEVEADGRLSDRPAEHVAADARSDADGPKLAFLRLVAGLLGVGFDDLRQRELQRRVRRLTLISAAAAAGMTLTLGLAVSAWRARNDARRRQNQAEDVVAFMLGGFRDELKKVGKLDLLSRVGDEATKYFASLDERDLTDTALARHAKALTQIGEVRMEEAKYAEAERVFKTAYERAAALAQRHPTDGSLLFERAQAEYWLAFVAWRRAELDRARGWSLRYRDSALTLARLDPTSQKAHREVSSSYHNLAVLEFEAAHFAAARAAFLSERANVEAMLAADPAKRELVLSLCDITSWLGLIAERCGRYDEAAEWLTISAGHAKDLVAAEPAVARWRVKRADALGLLAHLHARRGERAAAVAGYAEARAMLDALVAQDPKNQQWRVRALTVQFSEIEMRLAEQDYDGAAARLAPVRAASERLAAAEPSSPTFARVVAKAWRCEAIVRFARHQSDAAEAVQRAITLGEQLVHDRRADDWMVCELAQAHVLAGQIEGELGQNEKAAAHWRQAVTLTATPLAKSPDDWRFLEPALQAHTLLGAKEVAGPLIERLRHFGYHSPNPFVASLLEAASSTPSPALNK